MRLTKISKPCLGFTLIEMIVVISIIAVLSAISFVSYSGVQRGARDTKRQSDLKVIQSALEQYRADQTYYPVATFVTDVEWSIAKGSTIYLKKVPIDPTTNRNYNYKPYNARDVNIICDNTSTAQGCTGYCIYAQVEDDRNINYDPTNNKPKPSFCPDPDESVYNFVVTPI